MTQRKALKAGLWYTMSNILLKGIVFITLPIFTRILSTEEFGLYNTYAAYQAIVTVFTGICLYGSLRTAKYDYKGRTEEYSSSVLFLSCISMTIIMIFTCLFYEKISPYWEFNKFILILLLLHSYAMFVIQYYNTFIALNFEYKKFVIISFLNTFFNIFLSLAFILTIFSDNREIGRILGFALPPIIIAAFILIKKVSYNIVNRKKLINIQIWKYALVLSLPLVVHSFGQQLLAQFGRIMINKISGAEEAAIYGFVFTIVTILQIVILSMDNAWSVWFYDRINEKDYKIIREKSSSYVIFMVVLYAGFITVMPEVIKLMAPRNYWSGINIVIPMSFSMVFMFLYSLPVHVEYFYKRTKYIAIGTVFATILNLVSNAVLIPKYGNSGAAWSTVIAYIGMFVFHWIIARKIDSNRMFNKSIIIVSIMMCIIFSSVIYIFINSFLIRYFILIVFYFILYIVFRNQLKPLIIEWIKAKRS